MKEKKQGAVALGYKNTSTDAPRVIASGKGELAEEILRIARENKITVYEDGTLFESLYKLEVGDEIPVRLYRAVAEVLVFVYSLSSKRSGE